MPDPGPAVLTLRPTNLTRRPTTNGGTFPTIRVVMRIDGREPLVSHGSSTPIYGESFAGRDLAMKAPNRMRIMTTQPVIDLVVWLEGHPRLTTSRVAWAPQLPRACCGGRSGFRPALSIVVERALKQSALLQPRCVHISPRCPEITPHRGRMAS